MKKHELKSVILKAIEAKTLETTVVDPEISDATFYRIKHQAKLLNIETIGTTPGSKSGSRVKSFLNIRNPLSMCGTQSFLNTFVHHSLQTC